MAIVDNFFKGFVTLLVRTALGLGLFVSKRHSSEVNDAPLVVCDHMPGIEGMVNDDA